MDSPSTIFYLCPFFFLCVDTDSRFQFCIALKVLNNILLCGFLTRAPLELPNEDTT